MSAAVAVAAPEAPEVRRVQWARPWVTLAFGLAVPFLCAATLSEFANTVVVQAAIAVLTVAGLHVLVHWAGQISLAQVALMGVGAFVTARANADFAVPLPGAILLGTVGAVVASLAIGLPALRIRGLALAITTLAFGFAASRWLFLQTWLVPQVSGIPLRDQTLFGFDITQSRQLVIPVGVVCVAVVALTARLGNSAVGRALRMVAHDEEVAASYGISVPAHKLAAFCYAAACAGLAGAFTVVSIGRVGPQAFPFNKSVLFLSAVLLGGPGPLFGPLQAAASFAAFPVLARGLGRYIDLIGPLSILLVVTVSPAGLNGIHESLMRLRAAHAGKVHSPSPTGGDDP
jgi:branched-chain amino acid transport system permease protein